MWYGFSKLYTNILNAVLGPRLFAVEDILQENRVIELDARDNSFAHSLSSKYGDKFFALSRSLQINKEYIFEYTGGRQIELSSTDVYIFSGTSPQQLWLYDRYANAQYIAWTPSLFRFSHIFGLMACIKYIVKNKVSYTGKGMVNGRPFLVFKNVKPAIQKHRYFVHPKVGVNGFLKQLQEKSVSYTALRWFDNLPDLAPGEDLDILVDDEHIAAFESIVLTVPGLIPCDAYSITGQPGFEYSGMSYFPPKIAKSILSSATFDESSGAYVPDKKHSFYSLAYHALYHKGYISGVPSSTKPTSPEESPDHDYVAEMQKYADAVAYTGKYKLEDLDRFLKEHGLQPARDMLRRLAKQNEWIKDYHFADSLHTELRGLTVFIVREQAVKENRLPFIQKTLEDEGFNVLRSESLSEQQKDTLTEEARGGNWNKGPWPVSGGKPAHMYVVYDLLPRNLSPMQEIRFAGIDNERILVKHRIREFINHSLSKSESYNPIHSSDTAAEALEYMSFIFTQEEKSVIMQEIQNMQEVFATNERVISDLTKNGRRAKVELIEKSDCKQYVKKTFRPGREKFLDRSIYAATEFAEKCQGVPPLVEKGPNYIMYPYYEPMHEYSRGWIMPLWAAKKAMDILKCFYTQGYYLYDAHPVDVLVDTDRKVWLLDYEFYYAYKEKPIRFEESFDIVGAPDDPRHDQPILSLTPKSKTYTRCWYPHIGLSLSSLLHDPTWLQHIKRAQFRARRYPVIIKKSTTSGMKRIMQKSSLKVNTKLVAYLRAR
ncbi:MAG: hypothetical protein ACPGO5_01745 [Patescibacteria group bacterium]